MVLKIILACTVGYYLFVLIRYRDSIRLFNRNRKETVKVNEEKPLPENSIIGKSTYQAGQFKTIADVSGQENGEEIDDTNNADTFVPAGCENSDMSDNEGDEPDAEEYLTPEELDEIELYPEGRPFTAEGVTFEEMEHATKVLKKDADTEENERQALQTLAIIERTALYNDIVDGIDRGRLRVAEMMKKYDVPAKLPDNVPETDLSGFSLNSYM